MAEIIPEIERQNNVTSGLRRLVDASRARIAPPTTAALHTTLPDRRVLDRSGVLIYTPTPTKEQKPQ